VAPEGAHPQVGSIAWKAPSLATAAAGPAPVLYPAAMAEWPATYGVDPRASARRTALITGADSGIGFYAAQLLARLGFEVIIAVRPGFEKEAAAAARAIVEAVPAAAVVVPEVGLDLASFASVRGFAAHLRSRLAALDVFCCNAGRGGAAGDPREETEDSMEAIVQVNLLSHALLCCELLPLLQASAAARVVFHTSAMRLTPRASIRRKLGDLNSTGPATFNAFGQYQLSKAGMCLFLRALNKRLRAAGDSNVMACAADPGLSVTAINHQHDLARSAFHLPAGCLPTDRLHSAFGQHAADGALPLAMACVDGLAEPGSWYTPKRGLTGAPIKGDPGRHLYAKADPLNEQSLFPAEALDALWDQVVALTGADWRL